MIAEQGMVRRIKGKKRHGQCDEKEQQTAGQICCWQNAEIAGSQIVIQTKSSQCGNYESSHTYSADIPSQGLYG